MQLLSHKNKQCIFHIIGIGGIGMSAIAQIMHAKGHNLQGSDVSSNKNTDTLKKIGIKVFSKHDASNIENADFVIISSAIKDSNPELRAAKKSKKTIIRRYEILAELMRNEIGIAISGTHGKTTTTSMVASLFEAAELNPTVINGGIINGKDTNGYVGSGDFMIVEADESDETFIHLPAQISVITNIEAEHMDFYDSFDTILDRFKTFVNNIPFYGFGAACIDDNNTRILVSNIKNKNILTYGIESEDADIVAYNIRQFPHYSIFDIKDNKNNRHIADITLSVSGKYNILNSLAVIAIGIEMEFSADVIKNALKNFSGVKRRFTIVEEFAGATIIDDYAHHPTEIMVTLENARNFVNNSGGKIIAIFQPHRYSRLQSFFDEFSSCFSEADILYITDVFAAGESPIPNINTTTLIKNITNISSVSHIESLDSLVKDLANKDIVQKDDILIFMGAGDITNWSYNFTHSLRRLEYVKI